MTLRLSDVSYLALFTIVAAAALLDYASVRSIAVADVALSDAMVRSHAKSLPPDPGVVVIDIDERSLGRLADRVGRFPWPRSVYGELVSELRRQGAQAIVLDVELYEPDRVRPEHDRVLNEALVDAQDTFFPIRFLDPLGKEDGVKLADVADDLALARRGTPDPQARLPLELPFVLERVHWKRTGLINFLADDDGVGRRYWLERVTGGWAIPSLPKRVAVALGWPVPPGDALTIAWTAGGARSHANVSFSDVYEDLERTQRTRPRDEFAGRIVVVGSTATHLRDFRATPVDPLHPGVEILATAIDNLKTGRHLTAGPAFLGPALTFVLLAGLLVALRRTPSLLRLFAVLLASTLALLVAEWIALTAFARIVPTGAAIAWAWILFFAAALRAYFLEQRAREQRERVLSRFLDPRLVQRLVAEGVRLEDFRSETRTITILFSDIRGFTSLAERLPAETIVSVLNRYFTVQAETVFRHGGTLDKFIGDAIMAFWNAPTDEPRHAERAVACALDMVDTLERFNAELAAEGIAFEAGVGVHTGTAVVGFVGSERKLEYTAIGDSVNVASRIEGETRRHGRVLVSQATAAQAGEGWSFTPVGEVLVKGRTAAVALFVPEARR